MTSLPIKPSHENDCNTANEPEIDVIDSKDESHAESSKCTQYIENATIVNQNGEKNIHIDHVDTLNL